MNWQSVRWPRALAAAAVAGIVATQAHGASLSFASGGVPVTGVYELAPGQTGSLSLLLEGEITGPIWYLALDASVLDVGDPALPFAFVSVDSPFVPSPFAAPEIAIGAGLVPPLTLILCGNLTMCPDPVTLPSGVLGTVEFQLLPSSPVTGPLGKPVEIQVVLSAFGASDEEVFQASALIASIPEPGTGLLLAGGLAALWIAGRRRHGAAAR